MTVVERFLKYVTFDTSSDEESGTVPSTAKQLAFADYLAEELRSAGVADAARDELGYVYGHIPASAGCENCPKIGFISHMDTSPDVSGTNVKPRIITFDGKKDIPSTASLILVWGSIVSFLLNIFASAYFTTRSAFAPGKANFTFARELNSVSTGPGHSTEKCTFDFFIFASL